jgi:hypothetical protein
MKSKIPGKNPPIFPALYTSKIFPKSKPWPQIPKAVGLVNTFLVTGPLCRYAVDLRPMFEVLLLDDVRKSNRNRFL